MVPDLSPHTGVRLLRRWLQFFYPADMLPAGVAAHQRGPAREPLHRTGTPHTASRDRTSPGNDATWWMALTHSQVVETGRLNAYGILAQFINSMKT